MSTKSSLSLGQLLTLVVAVMLGLYGLMIFVKLVHNLSLASNCGQWDRFAVWANARGESVCPPSRLVKMNKQEMDAYIMLQSNQVVRILEFKRLAARPKVVLP